MEEEQKKEAERERKILERYQELGNPARKILAYLTSNIEPMQVLSGKTQKKVKTARWSELQKNLDMNEKVLKGGIDQLLKYNIIVKKDIGYLLHEKYHWQLMLIARKQSDKISLDSYRPDEIIDENTLNSKTTIYGLKSEIFRSVMEGSRNLNLNKEETLKFQKGIRVKEILGEFFGVPSVAKSMVKNSYNYGEYDEEDIIEKSVDYYISLLKMDGKEMDTEILPRIRSVIAHIISSHRNESFSFKDIGENFIQKISQLKRTYRHKELINSIGRILKNESAGKVRSILKNFEGAFALILNHCDISLGWLEETIFKFHGIGRGLYSTMGILSNKEKWARNNQFAKAVDKLSEIERERLIAILVDIVNENKDLYPTHVSIVCRVNSPDMSPDLSVRTSARKARPQRIRTFVKKKVILK